MKQGISGNRYDYLIEFNEPESKDTFQILCIHKSDRTSEIEGTFVEADLKKGKKLFDRTTDTFKDSYWIDYLEDDLDDDKEQGGWNENFKFTAK